MEILEQLVYWHWLILGMVLLSLETLGIGGFLIGMGIAAIIQGALTFVIPEMTWQVQLVVFGVMAVVFSLIYWKFFRGVNTKTDRPDSPAINDRASQMVSKTANVISEKKIQIGDVMWDYECDTNLEVDDKVIVTASSGMTLVVEKK